MTTQVDPALAAQIRNSDIINFVLDHFSKKSRRSFLEVLNNQRSRELQRSLLKGMRLTEKSIFESSVFRTRLLTGFEKGAGAAYLFVSLLHRHLEITITPKNTTAGEKNKHNGGTPDEEVSYGLLTVSLAYTHDILQDPKHRADRIADLEQLLNNMLADPYLETSAAAFNAYLLLEHAHEAKEPEPEPAPEPAAVPETQATPRRAGHSEALREAVAGAFGAAARPEASPVTVPVKAVNDAPDTVVRLEHSLHAVPNPPEAKPHGEAPVAAPSPAPAPEPAPEPVHETAAAPRAPEPEPEEPEEPLTDSFEIENELAFDKTPTAGCIRSLGYVRRAGRYTNLFLTANWDERIGLFIPSDLTAQFPRFGAVSLDSTSPLKLPEGAFYVLDWTQSMVYPRHNEYGELRSDFSQGISYRDALKSGRIRRMDETGGYVVVYPDLSAGSKPDFVEKIYVRFREEPSSECAADARRLHLAGVPVLLAAGDRLYGPVNLLEDSAHRAYVNFQLRSGPRLLKGFERPTAGSRHMTVVQNCVEDDVPVTVPVDVVFVSGLKRRVFDMLSDAVLLTRLSSSIAEGREERERMEEWADSHNEARELLTDNPLVSRERRRRIERLLKRVKADDEYFDSVIALLSKTIDRRIDDQSFFEEIVTRISKEPALIGRLESHRVVASRIENLRAVVSQLESRRETLDKEISSKLEQERREAQQAYKDLLEKNRRLEDECGKKREALSLMDDVDILTKQKDALQGKVDALEEKQRKFREEIDAVDEYVKQAVGRAHAYVFDGAIASKLLQAASDWENEAEETNFKARALTVSSLKRLTLTGKPLADYLVEKVRTYRDYDRDTILNFFILLTQNFLTVFSGEPGSGKTSICEILAYCLGLRTIGANPAVAQSGLWKKASDASRFLTVPVERGWTSKRDFIGYYNPLSKTFESTDARRRESFAQLDAENERGFTDIPFLMLLDEANLSPMEYYWGDFMRLCDSRTHTGETVCFGGAAAYSVPPSLRFAATINNDFTTENLSPRLLDRACIVRLPDPETCSIVVPDESDEQPIVSRAALERTFGARPLAADAEEIDSILEDIYTALRTGPGVSVSMRTRLAVRDYVSAGASVFSGDRETAYLTAIDFAVLERLLPRIDGNGADFRSELDKLQTILESTGLNRSRLELARIIERGDRSMGWYRYF